MLVDFIIVGQGLSGTFLSYFLQKKGASCLVVDDNKRNSASRMAAGLINPVTGRRMVQSWMTEELMAFAWQAYNEIGSQLQIECIRETGMLHFFQAPDMQDAFDKKLLQQAPYFSSAGNNDWKHYFNYSFGCGIVHPCYVTDVKKLLATYRQKLIQEQKLAEERFEVAELQLDNDHVRYRDVVAQKIIFCDGPGGFSNPWFGRLPYALNKGEALVLHIPGLPANYTYKFKYNLTPLDAAASLFWLGSSYEWEFDDDEPSEAFLKEARALLNHFLKLPFTVVERCAGLRPATVERRPFVGLHPSLPQLGILNGMGTKGCSLAPYFANELAEHIINNKAMLNAVDVSRFQSLLTQSVN